MDFAHWATVAASVIATVASAVVVILKAIPKVRKAWHAAQIKQKPQEDKAAAAVELEDTRRFGRRQRAINVLMREWLTRKGAQRCLYFGVHNCGKPWKGKLFVDNYDQVVNERERDTYDRWQNWPCDREYTSFAFRLLDALESQRGYPLEESRMPDCVLKKEYVRQGTVASLVLPFAWERDAELHYVSINFGRDPKRGGGRDAPEDPITDDERRMFVAAMEAIYLDVARVRGLVADLQKAWRTAA
ncbi:MAG: hypothetical protein HRU13_13545 [Phycisphaerales bacterium]|nr:hypothetical protein [Phycisphaerales bacterium]